MTEREELAMIICAVWRIVICWYGQAVVGISNWSLDPAKMNRAVHLYRPAPNAADLGFSFVSFLESVYLVIRASDSDDHL